MYLQRHTDPRTQLGIGQLCLALGIVLSRFGPHFVRSDLGIGFIDGLWGVLIGVSIALNLGGLVRMRRERE